jgi:chaperone required for assembly of F1-ATPase
MCHHADRLRADRVGGVCRSARRRRRNANVDEDWNMNFWGRDELALQRREMRFADMQAAMKVLALVG